MKGDFLWAVDQMKEGKRVKRDNKRLFKLEHNGIEIELVTRDDNKAVRSLVLLDYEATDWQIVEEKKTLIDKIYNAYKMGTKDVIAWIDVKEAIKEFIDWVTTPEKPSNNPKERLMNKAKEIFGERLIK